MRNFPIDPELHIRVSPPRVLRRTAEAMAFVREMASGRSGHVWQELQRSFREAADEWSAMEAVVKLELLLEAEGLLADGKPALPSACSPEQPSRAA
jgi:hypothetical protein